MTRSLALFLCSVTLIASCSRNPERTATTAPTPVAAAPEPGTLLGPTSVAPGGVSGKYDIALPARDQSYDFRNQLETKYLTGLGRAASPTFVDREGEVVWTQEYMRYRINGCDHATATQRVLSQVAGQAAGAVCGTSADGLIAFPPRSDAFDFRSQLKTAYQGFGRGASSSSVDAEGGVIWTQEYLRYRVNSCDHSTAVSKVFSQIDGGGVAATCYVPPCIYQLSTSTQAATAAGGTFTVTATRTSGDCAFTSESLDDFITIGSGTSGSGTSTITYTVGRNFGGARTGRIRVRWASSSALLEVTQPAGSSAAFTMTDINANASGTTTTCAVRSASTSCRLDIVSGLFSSNAVYTWRVEYPQGTGTPRSHDSSSTASSFTFTNACGGSDATASGNTKTITVRLTVTEGSLITTVNSGIAGQPELYIQYFTCS